MDFTQIGKRIKEYRVKNNLTQEEFAEKIGISRIYVSFMENGERVISLDVLEKISTCLNISMDYLVKGSCEDFHLTAASEFKQLIKKVSSEKYVNEILNINRALINKFGNDI